MADKTTPIIPVLPKTPVNPYGTPPKKELKKFDFTKSTDDVKKETSYKPVIEKKDAAAPDKDKSDGIKALDEANRIYDELIAEGDVLYNDWKLDEAEAKYNEALELNHNNEGAQAKLDEVAELRAEQAKEAEEAKHITRANDLIAEQKGLKEVTEIINTEFGTEYSWQKLSALVKGKEA